MSAGELLALFGGTGGGTALVFCALFITGLIHTKGTVDEKNEEIRELKHALELERQRSDAAVLAGLVVKDVMQGLRREIDQQ